MKRVHLRIAGHVQGVWFRESMRREAASRNVAGWVRNLPDGTVEAVLEGTATAVEELVEWARRGPERARVEHLDVRAEAPAGGLSGFQVLR